jgi:hypothetical protein
LGLFHRGYEEERVGSHAHHVFFFLNATEMDSHFWPLLSRTQNF